MAEIMDVQTDPTKTAQTPAPDTEPTGWMSPDGEFRDGAPEKIQSLLEAKKWTTIEQVVDSYLELERFKGAGEHLFIPKSEDDTEGWNNLYKQLGRPEISDKYEFSYEGDVEVSDELTGQFKKFAHGLGLTQKQFGEVVKFQLDAVAAQDEAYKTSLADREEKNIEAMKQKWGAANYDSTFKGIEATAEKLGVLEFFKSRGIDKEPEIVNMLITIANSDMEDVITKQPPTPTQKTPQEELEEIKKSESFIQKFHKDHKATMARFMELNQQIADAGQATQPRI